MWRILNLKLVFIMLTAHQTHQHNTHSHAFIFLCEGNYFEWWYRYSNASFSVIAAVIPTPIIIHVFHTELSPKKIAQTNQIQFSCKLASKIIEAIIVKMYKFLFIHTDKFKKYANGWENKLPNELGSALDVFIIQMIHFLFDFLKKKRVIKTLISGEFLA